MGVTYGITVAPHDDQYIDMAEKALDGMAKAANPGAFLVDIIPARKCSLAITRVSLSGTDAVAVKHVP